MDAKLQVGIDTIFDKTTLIAQAKEMASMASNVFKGTLTKGSNTFVVNTKKDFDNLAKSLGLGETKESTTFDIATGKTTTTATAGEKSKSGGFFGDLGGKLIGMIGPLGAAIGVITQMKPVMKMLGIITKAVVAFLQPISDVIVILLMPILALLKPIIMMVRTLMAPFRKVAMQLASAGAKAIATGDITAGIELITMALQTILLPFITVIVGESVRLAGNLLLSGVKEIVKLIIQALGPVIEFFGGNVQETLNQVDKGFSDIQKGFNDLVTDIELGALKGIANLIQFEIDTFVDNNKNLAEELGLDKIDLKSDVATMASNMQTDLANGITNLNLNGMVDNVKSEIEDALNTMFPNQDKESLTAGELVNAGVIDMAASKPSTNKKTEASDYIDIPGNPFSKITGWFMDLFGITDKISDNPIATSVSNVNLGYIDMNKIITDNMSKDGIIPTNFSKGFSNINMNVNKGFTEMESRLTNFSKVSNEFADSLSKAVDKIQSAAKKASTISVSSSRLSSMRSL